jgi:peptide/nickel transport system substrate-binding protein
MKRAILMGGLMAAIGLGMFVAPLSEAQAQKLTVAVASPPRTMDPYGSDADSNLSVMANIFEGLLQRDSAGTLKPALATAWERVDDTTWRFKLRKGVKFHNGNDFTWEDVKFSLERLSNPEVSEFLNFGSLIESVAPVGGDDWTVEIKTKHPVPFFDQNLHQIFIMDKESTESRSPGEIGQKPIGTGPYMLDEWVKGSFLRLKANPDYWEGKPSVEIAELREVTEASTGLAAIMSGSVDILQDVPVASVDMVAKSPKVEVITRPARRSIWLGLANRKGMPSADVRVRRAMYHAINEDEIVQKVMFGRATPAAQIPDPPTTGYSDAIKRLAYDPEKAKQLLKEAGYADGFKIKLSGPNDRYIQDEQIEAAVASQLAKVGIDVEVDSKPKSIFFKEVSGNGLDFYLIGWFDGSYDFGRSYAKLLHTVDKEGGYGGLNGSSYSNPELDAIFAKSQQIIDTGERKKTLQELNEKAMDEVAIIPLHYQEDIYAVTKGRGINFKPRSDTWIVFKEMSIGG